MTENKVNLKKSKRPNIWLRIRRHFISCAGISSIHGLPHIVRKNVNPYERFLWLLLVSSASIWCIYLGLQAFDRYQTRPTVISLERDHWKWNTTFPAVTLCLDGIDNNKTDQLVMTLGISQENAEEFKEFLSRIMSVDFINFKDFDRFMNISACQDVEKYLEWLLYSSLTLDYPVEITQSFGELQEFETILTEFGLCFAYNSKIAMYSSSPKYWKENNRQPLEQNVPTIMINPAIPGPSLSLRNLESGYKIFFHGPNEIPEMNTKGFTATESTFTNFEISIQSVWTPSEVKDLTISQRNCRLPDEGNSASSAVYSYNLCRMECRRKLCFHYCHCTPYYYKRCGNEPICNPLGMRCLYEHKDSIMHLIEKQRQSICSCIQNCDVDTVTISKEESTDWFLGTNVQWQVVQYPTIRYRRSLIFSRTNLLVQIGGIAGLLLGCSILSLIELFYFVTLRFYWCVVKGRKV